MIFVCKSVCEESKESKIKSISPFFVVLGAKAKIRTKQGIEKQQQQQPQQKQKHNFLYLQMFN